MHCSEVHEIAKLRDRRGGWDGLGWEGGHLRFTAAVDGDTALADAALSPGTQRGADPGIKVKEMEI